MTNAALIDASRRNGPQPFTNPQPPTFYDCGICGHYHPINWDGDCRDDANRFTAGDLDDKYGDGEWIEKAMPDTDFDDYIEMVEHEQGIIIRNPEHYRAAWRDLVPYGSAEAENPDYDPDQLLLPLH